VGGGKGQNFLFCEEEKKYKKAADHVQVALFCGLVMVPCMMEKS
jgi:hypothetical protein